ncbi:hypothetical protein A3C37_03395 [Candidatus Peribacteria bacterium RIFCSPHIGHO2_02_FULL_53_20]|nr:MAG: hypothetical protein A3C37_03395 [Candidatus Peribacteria bacterium RIFCSPHIGHO2_02_FULL_53_20]OGJ67386.1 MAG: hypothetical protein A3B61_00435 [Candidatus Peribacteria bacterium RIFCSPLOWO2_01_FULL_53_10]OGJ72638.1 MAG: hypothetical protein A3G69_01830 [Candidatus Peribacteria bacterium RIFCSPLOWO2_12_FULL_53_10]
MKSTRMEAFSDGVIAILITIMVLEFNIPQGNDLAALVPILPLFLAYILSFVYLAIYWNNHHHLMQVTDHVDGRILWANMHLLFWLSLVPFTTAWMAETHFAMIPTALYGLILLLAALGYSFLVMAITAHGDANHLLRKAIGRDKKGKISLLIYVLAVALAAVHQWISLSLYALVAIIWLIPDRRIEKVLGH